MSVNHVMSSQIGCISGKVHVVRSRSYEDACAQVQGVGHDWFFCRGYFMQASNSFQYYTDAELSECSPSKGSRVL